MDTHDTLIEPPREGFENSKVGELMMSLIPVEPPLATSEAPTTLETDAHRKLHFEELRVLTFEMRALIARVRAQNWSPTQHTDEAPQITQVPPELLALLDTDLAREAQIDLDPTYAVDLERWSTFQRLKAIVKDHPEVLASYRQIYEQINGMIKHAKSLKTLSESTSLTQQQRTIAARQMIGILRALTTWCDDEVENIHNQVVRERRGYRDSDRAILKKIAGKKQQCEKEIGVLRTSMEVQIQDRHDAILKNQRMLAGKQPKEMAERYKGLNGSHYVLTKSRRKLVYGSETEPCNSILDALRVRNNVELVGPTGTGKTEVAKFAALLFSGKEPIVVTGNANVSSSAFMGKPAGLRTATNSGRDEGAFIQCAKEGRVLIIDEDNRILPEVLAVIKAHFGLKPGQTFIHHETGERIVVQNGFGIIVTRNEAGKHHKDRHDLEPEYRREFSRGNFEVGYFPPQELYDEFLIPSLVKEDGSTDLSEEEIGGSLVDATKCPSPLLELAKAAEEIQIAYMENKMKDGVFEAGMLINLFEKWEQMKQRTGCSLTQFLETRLIEFIKRRIGNPARKIIIGVLVNHGFFYGKTAADFATDDEGEPVTDAELAQFRSGEKAVTLSKKPSWELAVNAAAASAAATPPPAGRSGRRAAPVVSAGAVTTDIFEKVRDPKKTSFIGNKGMSSNKVALLDPWNMRKLEEPIHPHAEEIEKAYEFYIELIILMAEKEAKIGTPGPRPIQFVPNDCESKIHAVFDQIIQYMMSEPLKNIKGFRNSQVLAGSLSNCIKWYDGVLTGGTIQKGDLVGLLANFAKTLSPVRIELEKL